MYSGQSSIPPTKFEFVEQAMAFSGQLYREDGVDVAPEMERN